MGSSERARRLSARRGRGVAAHQGFDDGLIGHEEAPGCAGFGQGEGPVATTLSGTGQTGMPPASGSAGLKKRWTYAIPETGVGMPANTGEANMRDEHYTALAEWAENEMVLNPDSPTALHGPAAAAAGRALLASVRGPEQSDPAG